MNSKNLSIIASLLLGAGVLLGAFGAHGLKSFATPKALEYWQTATLYLFIHALGVFVVAILTHLKLTHPRPAYCLLAGILIFCGSLYLMALGLPRWLGAITPIGGTLFVAGWVWLAMSLKNFKA